MYQFSFQHSIRIRSLIYIVILATNIPNAIRKKRKKKKKGKTKGKGSGKSLKRDNPTHVSQGCCQHSLSAELSQMRQCPIPCPLAPSR